MIVGIVCAALVGAPEAAFSAHRSLNYAVLAKDFSFRGIPGVLPAATYDTVLYNVGNAPHVLVNLNLGSSCDDLDTDELIELFDAIHDAGPVAGVGVFLDACPDGAFGGSVFALGGGRSVGELNLTPGSNVFVCFVNRHYALGMYRHTTVVSVG